MHGLPLFVDLLTDFCVAHQTVVGRSGGWITKAWFRGWRGQRSIFTFELNFFQIGVGRC